MDKKSIARLICQLIESRDWQSWKCEGITECTELTSGQVAMGLVYLNSLRYVKKDYKRGKKWWTRTKVFGLWKFTLGTAKTKLDMSTGKLVYA
jgi:DNA-binding transcriptional regulator GbsR (MarR family)